MRDAEDRVRIDDTKTRRSDKKTVQLSNCPTQAKTGLEWATRPRARIFLIEEILKMEHIPG
jgi:hypothetical protein